MKTEKEAPKQLSFRLSLEERKAFDVLCTQNDTSMQEVLLNFVQSVLKSGTIPKNKK